MERMQQEQSTLDQTIIHIVKNENPATVAELVNLIQQKHSLSQNEIIVHILNLQSQGRLNLKENPSPLCSTMVGFFLSRQACWYWITSVLVLTTLISIFAIPENSFPAVYVRYILGAIFVLWLPGYSFIKALFPTEVPIPTRTKELDNIERIALSIGMSLAIVPLTGLLLNYTPWGITSLPIALSLLALTLTFATIAVIREYQMHTLEGSIPPRYR